MQIKEINISNFGTLSDYSISLNANLNQIIEKNGFGKSTLMAFIKSMFYGFQKKGERQKYLPWNKGICGGYIIFEFEDEDFRLERTFGSKSSQDETKLFKLSTLEELDIEDIGFHFFGLDQNSFERLLYVDENMLSATTSSLLIGKLTKQSQNQQQVTSSYEEALKTLDNKRSFYFKQGNKGEIANKTYELNSLKRELDSANQSLELSKKYECEIKELKEVEIKLKQELIEIDNNIELASKQEYAKQNAKQLNFLMNEKQILEDKISNINSIFPLGFPDADSINSYSNKIAELNSFNSLLETYENELNNQETNLLAENFEDKKQLAIDLISSVNTKKERKTINKLSVSLLSASSLCLIACILLFILNLSIPAIISGALFFICFLIFLITFFKNSNENNKANTLQKLNSLFPNQNFSSTQDALQKITALELDISSQNKIKEKIKEAKINISRLEQELNNFNSNFKLTNLSFAQSLDFIKSNISKHEDFIAQLSKINEQILNFENLNKNNEFNFDLDLNNLKAKKVEKTTSLDRCIALIHEKESKKMQEDNNADKIDLLSSQIATTKQTLEEYEQDLTAIQFATKFLKDAKVSLSSKYLAPTEKNLNDLAQSFPQTKKYLPLYLKEDLSILYEENNSLRESNTLSTGLEHSFAILTRIALINTIFENSSVPIFLDDPFYSLDENNLNSMQELISSLSKKHQIIYFTCSNERIM